MIEYSFHNAKMVEKELSQKENWEIVSKPSCGTINFRYAPKGLSLEETNKLNLDITKELNDGGYAYIVTTTLHGMKTIRMCMINANSTVEDIMSTIDRLDQIAKKLTKEI